MKEIFTVLDKDNIPVTLSSEVWYHKLMHPIFGHLEVKPYLEEIKETIKNPDFIYRSIKDIRVQLLYKKGLIKGKYAHCYILAVVKYVEEVEGKHGYVSTIMIPNNVKRKGGLLWKKSNDLF